MPTPTIHRLLRTLMASGYIYQTPRRRYALGTRLISLSRYAGGALGVALRPILTQTAVVLDESISVAMLDQDYARYISHVPSERTQRMFAEVGNQVSLHATGVGKAILAAMPPAQALATIERTQLRAFTPATITGQWRTRIRPQMCSRIRPGRPVPGRLRFRPGGKDNQQPD